MTREMVKQIERDYWREKADPIDMAEIFDLAQKALEQEPTTKNDYCMFGLLSLQHWKLSGSVKQTGIV